MFLCYSKLKIQLVIIMGVFSIMQTPEFAQQTVTRSEREIKTEISGRNSSGEEIKIFTLTNRGGMSIKITNYGGIVTDISVPDRNGNTANVVLGFASPFDYMQQRYKDACPHFGAIIGRYGNRIAKGEFTLDGKKYSLARNNGAHHLHGGVTGFDKVVWNASTAADDNSSTLTLKYLSPDGEEGYPGNLNVTVDYTLTDKNELIINYLAATDKATPLNLTHHSYFNLAGEGNGDVLEHEIMIAADKYIPVDETLIPTGKYADVSGTPFDLRKPKRIADGIEKVEGGYDNTFVLNKTQGADPDTAAFAYDMHSGRTLEVYTTEPGIQFYTGNFLDGTLTGPSGKKYGKHAGFCLETQHFPDSPNQPAFPSTVLRPGEKYISKTIYKFGVQK